MKNERKRGAFLRLFGFIAISAIAGCSMIACEFLNDLLHEHDYGEWKTNATQHWKECECGDKIEVGNHTGNNSGNTCNTCGKAHEHAYGDTYYKDTAQHWKECACGSKDAETTGNHSYFYWGKDATQHWKECICGLKQVGSEANHSFSTTYKYDTTEHWRECECYQKSYIGAHTFGTGDMCTFGQCYYTKSVNSAFIGPWIRYNIYSDGSVNYTRYTFNDDGTGLSESKYSSSDEIYSTNFVWSAAGGQLMLELIYGELSVSQNLNYLIEGFTLSTWTNPESKSYYIRQAGDGSMDERLTADTWINDATVNLVEELRFFSDGTASQTNKLGSFTPTVTNYIWTAKDGQYKLYSVTGTESIFTYTISGSTLNTSNSASGAKVYNKKYGNGYAIGATGPGGGKVIYDKGNDRDGGWRYLEAALENQGSSVKWASEETFVPGATGQEIGTGKANTLAIIAAFPDDTELNNASKAAAAYRGGGKDDWFLPSRYELSEIYKQRSLFGITEGNYFTSSEYGEDSPANIYALGFSGSSDYPLFVGVPKSFYGTNYHVRPVRYF